MNLGTALKKLSLATLLLPLLVVVLSGASLLPDACSATDDCCSHDSVPGYCGTLCCSGVLATPGQTTRLEQPLRVERTPDDSVPKPLVIASEPLLRPPIPA